MILIQYHENIYRIEPKPFGLNLNRINRKNLLPIEILCIFTCIELVQLA